MESTYRAWVRQKRERLAPDDLDGLCRELQTALGTAKWQVGLLSLIKLTTLSRLFIHCIKILMRICDPTRSR